MPPAPPADPATDGFPIRLPEIVPTRVPPVDCEDENTLTACRMLPVIGVATVPLLRNLNARFEDVSCVKLAWMPLLMNVLPETVIVPTVAVSCAWTSSARCGVLFWNALPLIVPAVRVEVPEPSNRNALAPVMSLTSLKLLPVTDIDARFPEVLRTQKPLCALPLTDEFAIVSVPSTPTTLPLASPNWTPSSDVELPLLLTFARLSVKFVIALP